MKENKEKKIKNCDEISKLIKAFPKDIAHQNDFKMNLMQLPHEQNSKRQDPEDEINDEQLKVKIKKNPRNAQITDF